MALKKSATGPYRDIRAALAWGEWIFEIFLIIYSDIDIIKTNEKMLPVNRGCRNSSDDIGGVIDCEKDL